MGVKHQKRYIRLESWSQLDPELFRKIEVEFKDVGRTQHLCISAEHEAKWHKFEFDRKMRELEFKYKVADIQGIMPHGYLLNSKWIVADLIGFLGKAHLAMLIFDLETIDLAKFAYSYRNDDDYCLFNGNRPIVLDLKPCIEWSLIDGFIRGIFDCYGQWEFTREDLFMFQGILGAKMRSSIA